MAKTLRVRTKNGWVTKPLADIPANSLSSIEVDDNFLALEEQIEGVRNTYYGPLVEDPTTRPGGSPMQDGDEYHNTVTGDRMVFQDGVWGSVLGKLRDDLSNNSDPTKGSGMMSFNPELNAVVGSVGRALLTFVCVEWFGAACDGVTDDVSAIRAAIARAQNLGIGEVYLGKTHMISETIVIPAGITLIGRGRDCKLIPSASGVYIQGFMFLVNSSDGTTGTVAYPNAITGGIKRVSFWNGDSIGVPIKDPLRAVRGFGSCMFSEIRGRNMTQIISRPSGGYHDTFDVEDVHCNSWIGSEYLVDIRGLGDGLRVGKLHFPKTNAGVPLGLYIGGCMGGRVGECIGGDVMVRNSKISFENGHYEYGQIVVDGANVDFRSVWMSTSNRVPLVLQNTGGQECVVTLDGCEFVYLAGLLEWQGSDVQIAAGVTLSVKDSYRRYSKTGSIDKSQQHGLTVENASGTPISEWNDFSYELSRSGRIYRGQIVDLDFTIYPRSSAFVGISGVASDSTETWLSTSGTYYYQSQYILDKTRLIGRTATSPERSIALVAGGNGARITIDYNGKPSSAILRVYRGVSSGVYTEYVDIPLFSARLFYDSGLTLNGRPWQPRAGGPEVSINGLGESHIAMRGANIDVIGSAAPTVGSWSTGDNIYRAAPSASGKRAWTCVASGVPGTWKQWGA